MKEIRLHGRGGQGVVKASQIIVKAAVAGGSKGQFIPFFGVERKGSPVFGYLRLSDGEIRRKTQIYEPDMLVIMDDSLVGMEATYSGLKEGGTIIINSVKTREELNVPPQAGDVWIVDATGISEELFGRNIPNTAMLGAFVKATGLVEKDVLFEAIGETFGEANTEAAERAFEEVCAYPADGQASKKPAAEEAGGQAVKKPAAEEAGRQTAQASAPAGSSAEKAVKPDGQEEKPKRKHITPKGGEGMYILDTASWRVFRPVMDKDKCVECGLCMAYCPVNSVVSKEDSYVISYDYCKGCGLCAKECPRGAISMEPEADFAADAGAELTGGEM